MLGAALTIAALLLAPPVMDPANVVPRQALAYGAPGDPAKSVTDDNPLPAAAPASAWSAASVASILSANTYQAIFSAGQAVHGGVLVNTSAPGSGPIWVDVTGATGTTLGNGAVPVFPAITTGGSPGAWRFPGTTRAVTVYGPAGATFRSFGG